MILGEEHHWWPKSLSKGWRGDYNKIWSIRSNGYRKPYAPKAIGKIADGHNIALDGPWASSFERFFDPLDRDFPALVAWAEAQSSGVSVGRAVPLFVAPDRREMLATCIASLVARNPTMRDRVRRFVEHFWPNLSIDNPKQMGVLIASNIRGLYDHFRKAMLAGGRFALLVSPNREFIFGDGFLQNFPHSVGPSLTRCTCVVPISPTRTVLWHLPISSWSYPREAIMTLSEDETDLLNDTVQIYSREFIYYRYQAPTAHPSLELREHQSWFRDGVYHEHPVIEAMKDRIMSLMLSKPFSGVSVSEI